MQIKLQHTSKQACLQPNQLDGMIGENGVRPDGLRVQSGLMAGDPVHSQPGDDYYSQYCSTPYKETREQDFKRYERTCEDCTTSTRHSVTNNTYCSEWKQV